MDISISSCKACSSCFANNADVVNKLKRTVDRLERSLAQIRHICRAVDVFVVDVFVVVIFVCLVDVAFVVDAFVVYFGCLGDVAVVAVI